MSYDPSDFLSSFSPDDTLFGGAQVSGAAPSGAPASGTVSGTTTYTPPGQTPSGTYVPAVGPNAGTVQPITASPTATPQPQAVAQPPAGNYDDLIAQAAKANKVPPELIKAFMQQESGGNPNAVSSAGATGLMQLMPQTAAGLGVTDIRDPAQNINAGAKYIRQALNASGGDVYQAAAYYFGGPNIAMHGPKTAAYAQQLTQRYEAQLSASGASKPAGQQVAYDPSSYVNSFNPDGEGQFESDVGPGTSPQASPAAAPSAPPSLPISQPGPLAVPQLTPAQQQQLAQLKAGNLGGGAGATPQPQAAAQPNTQPSPAPSVVPPAAQPYSLANVNGSWSGQQEWANAIGLGVPKYLAAGVGAIGGALEGNPLVGTYQANLAKENAGQAAYEAAHPVNAFDANAVGPIPVEAVGAGVLGAGLRGAGAIADAASPYIGGALRFLAGDAGSGGTVANIVAKGAHGALTGSAMGAAGTLTSPSQGSAERGAIIGGTLGGGLGTAAAAASPYVTPYMRRAVNDLQSLGVNVPLGTFGKGMVASSADKAGIDTLHDYTRGLNRLIGVDSDTMTKDSVSKAQATLGDNAKALANNLPIDTGFVPKIKVNPLPGGQAGQSSISVPVADQTNRTVGTITGTVHPPAPSAPVGAPGVLTVNGSSTQAPGDVKSAYTSLLHFASDQGLPLQTGSKVSAADAATLGNLSRDGWQIQTNPTAKVDAQGNVVSANGQAVYSVAPQPPGARPPAATPSVSPNGAKFQSDLQGVYQSVVGNRTATQEDVRAALEPVQKVMGLAATGNLTGPEVAGLLAKDGEVWKMQQGTPYVQQVGTALRTILTNGMRDTANANGNGQAFNAYMGVRNAQRIAATIAPAAAKTSAETGYVVNPKDVATLFKNERPNPDPTGRPSNSYILSQAGKILPTPQAAAKAPSSSMLHNVVRGGAALTGAALAQHVLGPVAGTAIGGLAGYGAEEIGSHALRRLATSPTVRNAALRGPNPFSTVSLAGKAAVAGGAGTGEQLHPNLQNPYTASGDDPTVPLQP